MCGRLALSFSHVSSQESSFCSWAERKEAALTDFEALLTEVTTEWWRPALFMRRRSDPMVERQQPSGGVALLRHERRKRPQPSQQSSARNAVPPGRAIMCTRLPRLAMPHGAPMSVYIGGGLEDVSQPYPRKKCPTEVSGSCHPPVPLEQKDNALRETYTTRT